MDLTQLNQLQARVAAAIAGGLTIDRPLLSADLLSNHWLACLGSDTITLAEPVTVSPVAAAGFFTIAGETGLLECPAQAVTLTFFLSSYAWPSPGDATPPAEPMIAVECLIDIGSLPADWLATGAYPTMPSYPDFSGGDSVLKASFFGQIPLNKGKALYSSYDFVGAEALNAPLKTPAATTTSPTSIPVDKVRAGVNLSGEIDTTRPDGPWTDVSELWRQATRGSLPEAIPVTALVSRAPQSQARQIAFTYACADASGKPPSLELPAPFASTLSLTQLVISSGLDAISNIDPVVTLTAELDVDGAPLSEALVLTLTLPLGAGQGSLQVSRDTPLTLTPDWLAKLGLGKLSELIDDLDKGLGDLGLTDASIAFTVSPAAVQAVTVGVKPERPWVLVPDLIAVAPSFVFGVDFTAAATADPYLEIFADWHFGEVAKPDTPVTILQVHTRTDTGDVSVALAPGETLNIGAVFELLGVPAEHRPNITLAEFEIDGNYGVGGAPVSFSLDVEAIDVWTLDLGAGASLAVTDILLEAEYDPLSQFTGRLSGALDLGGCVVDVGIQFGDGPLDFSVQIPQLNIGDLIDDMLKAVDLPDELGSFIIDVQLDAQPSAGLYTFTASAQQPVDVFTGFSFVLSNLSVSRKPGPPAPNPPPTAPPPPTPTPADIAAEMDLALQLGAASIAFTGAYDNDDGWAFTASDATQGLFLDDLVNAVEAMVGLDYPLPSGGLGISDIQATLALAPKGGARSITASCALVFGARKYGSLTFIAYKGVLPSDPAPGDTAPPGWRHVLVAEPTIPSDFTKLPLVGPEIAALIQISDAALIVASDAFSKEDTALLAGLLHADATPPVALSGPLDPGALFNTGVTLAGVPYPLSIPLDNVAGAPPPAPETAGPPPPRTPPANDSTKWFPVHLTLGPISLDRIGLRYASPDLFLMMDAGMTLGPVSVSLLGFGVGSPLDHVKLAGQLDGLGVSLQTGPVVLSGGLVHQAGAYSGVLQVSLEDLSLAVLGQYADGDDGAPTSLFMFGFLDEPLGGPPFFFVEGLALGFGYNSKLNRPALSDVANFPIVKAAFPGLNPFAQAPDLETILAGLTSSQGQTAAVSIQSGENWLAAGVRFSAFELVDAFALVTAEFGDTLEFSILGLAQASIPPDTTESPLAFVQVALEATYDPAQGALEVFGQLTDNSYVLSTACHLTGGFAFCTWFKDIVVDGDTVSAGDFVYTLGGYHPLYTRPAHYPQVPRLGLFWQVDDNLTVQGDAYFALTPYCVMAGGALSAVWSSGDVRAWFDLAADFLMYWKPFRYEAEFSVSIGVSYRLHLLVTTVTVSVSVDVDIELEGPDFGGSADIDLRLFSITISFGAESDDPGAMGWTDFQASFLPRATLPTLALPSRGASDPIYATGVFKAFAKAGLFRDLSSAPPTDGTRWVFQGEDICIDLISPIPMKTLSFNGAPISAPSGAADLTQAWSSEVGVGPMRVKTGDLTSDVTIVLTYDGAPYSLCARDPITRSLPASLWQYSETHLPALPDGKGLLDDVLCGLRLSRSPLAPDTTQTIDIANLQYETASAPIYPWEPVVPAAPPSSDSYAPVVNPTTEDLTFTVDGPTVTCVDNVLADIARPVTARDALIAVMRARGLPVSDKVDVSALAETTVLADWPRVCRLGEVRVNG